MAAHEAIVKQGEHGTTCYIIQTGGFDCVKRMSRKEYCNLDTATIKQILGQTAPDGEIDELVSRPSSLTIRTQDRSIGLDESHLKRAISSAQTRQPSPSLAWPARTSGTQDSRPVSTHPLLFRFTAPSPLLPLALLPLLTPLLPHPFSHCCCTRFRIVADRHRSGP